MADFVQTMKDWRRMCNYYDEKNGNNSCEFCPLNGCNAIYEDDGNTDYSDIEKKVAAWAAENPEPVYPTFAEWMYDSFLKWCQENYPGRAKDEKAWFDYIYETRIPADTAQKLGIEPKGCI